MYGTTWCQDCKRAKQFFGEHRVPYAFVDVDQDEDGLRLVERVNDGKRVIPTIVFADGAVLVEPSNVALAEKLGLQTHPDCPYYDLVVERSAPGGQAGVTEQLDNYPGFPDGISGADFANRLVAQARRFGVDILSAAEVNRVASDGQYRVIGLANGDEVRAQAVLLAPGATYRRLGIPGEDDFIGAGVHLCATCDGPFYRGQEMLVVGAGNSAAEGALFLARFASRVIIVVSGAELSASELATTKVLGHPRIEVRPNTVVKEFRGDTKLRSVVLHDTATSADDELFPGAVFVFVGLEPNTQFLRGVVDVDEAGFVRTSPTLETSQPGVFAAGDARQGSTKQLVSAAGEGATAALMVRQYLHAARAAPASIAAAAGE